jgi:hypothetical protein
MKNLIKVIIFLTVASCATVEKPAPVKEDKKEIELGKRLKGRFTVYASAKVKSDPNGNFCLQDSNNGCISPKLNRDKVCFLQMQGSGMVDDVMYSWSSPNKTTKHSCATWGSTYARSNVTRFKVNNVSHSIGSFNNILRPFYSVACPREFKNRQRIYVPAAVGVRLPNNSIHDGIFTCDDRGGAIVKKADGTYKIDTFIGLVHFHPWKMNDWGLTGRTSPFKHTANQKITHDFYLIK